MYVCMYVCNICMYMFLLYAIRSVWVAELAVSRRGGGGGELAYVMILGYAIILGTFLGCSLISGYLFGLLPDFWGSFLVKFICLGITQIFGY